MWDSHPRLSCAALAGVLLIAVLAVFIVGLAHPLVVMAVGAVLVGVCGVGLLLVKD